MGLGLELGIGDWGLVLDFHHGGLLCASHMTVKAGRQVGR